MGAWGIGPFENDSAAEWCDSLEDADPATRSQIVEEALAAAADDPDYIDYDEASAAIAAAAIVASTLPGGAPIDSSYAPEFLIDGGRLELSENLPTLAIRALERITGDESEWRDLWSESGQFDEALAEIDAIQAALSG